MQISTNRQLSKNLLIPRLFINRGIRGEIIIIPNAGIAAFKPINVLSIALDSRSSESRGRIRPSVSP
jgi:hypothetical protein